MGKQILILGGGFGGLAAANELRKGLGPEHKVVLVDQQPLFLMGLTKLWVLDGRRPVGANPGNRTHLTRKGIDFVEGQVASINVEGKMVQVGKQKLSFDYLIIALGADYSAATPGFTRYAKNLYTESGCAEIRDVLRSTLSGSITVLVCGLPFKCPPAPYEASFLIDSLLRSRGIREHVSMRIVTPEPHPLPILGPEGGKLITDLLALKNIDYYPKERVREIRSGSLVTESGRDFSQTLLFAVPTHIVPPVVSAAGLIDQSGWIPVDPKTLATHYKDIYAIGDCAGTKNPKGQLIPRAGSLAEEEGKVVAANLIHELAGDATREEFQGKGTCFIETGKDRATPLQANFYAEPTPTWESKPPSAEGLTQKVEFLEERMKAWFS
jgi:sulfide:quinone oxidoreductase